MPLTTTVRRTARKARNSAALEILTRIGLVGYGVLHLAVAWLALQIANGAPAAEGDQSGAFRVLAAQPLGVMLVWVIAVGLAAMAIWQLFETTVGHADERGGRRVVERVVSGCRTVIYAALAWTAYQVVNGVPASNVDQQRTVTSGLLGQPGGLWLVGALGVVVCAAGCVIAIYGITKGFERRLNRSQMSGRALKATVLTGQVGYAIKGSAYAVVGVLLVVAAVTFDPQKSTGLDGALRTLAAQPFGHILLLIVALGFAVFGVYCFFQSRYRKV